MYALVLLVPFVLLGTVMGLSWWEDKVLPDAVPGPALAEAPLTPPTPSVRAELLADSGSLPGDVPER